MRIHQLFFVVSALITFVASASLTIEGFQNGFSQKFGSCETEQVPCDNIHHEAHEAYMHLRSESETNVFSFKEKIRREDSEASIPTKNTDNLDLSIDVGLIMISLSIDLVNYGINAEVYFKAIVNIRIAKASGSLKGGSTLTLGLSNILDGTLMFRIEDEDVVLYYGFHAFENVSNNRAVVLHLPDAKKGESLETKILDVFLPSEKQT